MNLVTAQEHSCQDRTEGVSVSLTEMREGAQTADRLHLQRAIHLRHRDDVKPHPQLAHLRQPEVLSQPTEPASVLRVE